MLESLESRRLLAGAAVVDRVVQVSGTGGKDVVELTLAPSGLSVSVNGAITGPIDRDDFDTLWIDTGGGNDFVNASRTHIPATILGGNGRDLLLGSDADDLLVGGAGDDTLEGGEGDDTVNGGRDDDLIDGGVGANQLFGAGGIDVAESASENDITDGAETVRPYDRWVAEDVTASMVDLRVKTQSGRGHVAVLDFVFNHPGYREAVTMSADGRTFRLTVALSVWTGDNLAVITRDLKTVTLGELPPGTWQVVVQRPDGSEVERRRFTAG
jgi:hypothetical protein